MFMVNIISTCIEVYYYAYGTHKIDIDYLLLLFPFNRIDRLFNSIYITSIIFRLQ